MLASRIGSKCMKLCSTFNSSFKPSSYSQTSPFQLSSSKHISSIYKIGSLFSTYATAYETLNQKHFHSSTILTYPRKSKDENHLESKADQIKVARKSISTASKSKSTPKTNDQILTQDDQLSPLDVNTTNKKKKKSAKKSTLKEIAGIDTNQEPDNNLGDEGDMVDEDIYEFIGDHQHRINQPLPLHCIFKVMTTATPPRHTAPWQKRSSREYVGTGCSVNTPYGVKLLTNAHVVAHATTVKIRRSGSSFMYTARVVASADECDLALLEVTDDAFWQEGLEFQQEMIEEQRKQYGSQEENDADAGKQKVERLSLQNKNTGKKASKSNSKKPTPIESHQYQDLALDLGNLPHLEERVSVIGYPTGGDNISVTRGVVSRIETQAFQNHGHELLAVQIDAAINPGNSGGPALDDNLQVVGIAFSALSNAENIGYIIPTPIIIHFLEDLQRHNGKYMGFVRLGISVSANELTPAACEYFKIDRTMGGVLINNFSKVSDAVHHFKKDDILLQIDGVPLAHDGSILFRGRERVRFDYLMLNKYVGDSCKVAVWREGKQKEFELNLVPRSLELLPSSTGITNSLPFVIYGGLVFTRATEAYLDANSSDNGPSRALQHLYYNYRDTDEGHKHTDQEIVVLSRVLPDECNYGYIQLSDATIHKVNGVEVRNLRHLDKILAENKEEFVRIDFEADISTPVVMKHAEAIAAAERISHSHGLPKLRHLTEDLLPLPDFATSQPKMKKSTKNDTNDAKTTKGKK